LAKGYTISRVINGCWQLSEGHSLKGVLDSRDIMRAFHTLAEKGFTTFDCADIYTGAEEFIGAFIAELKNGSGVSPDDIQIHTKFVPDLGILGAIDYGYTEKIIDRSLKRTRRETLDLVQFHWWDYNTPGCIETAGYLCRLKDKGKIRHIGATNFDTEHLAQMIDAGIPVVSIQSQYSVFDRRPEKKLLPYCKGAHIPLICYGTLSGGFLSERWMGQAYTEPETRSQVKYAQVIEDTLGWGGYQELLRLLDRVAKTHGVSIANVASKYILSRQGIGAVIIGVRNSRHVESNARIFDFEFDSSEIAEIEAFLSRCGNVGGEPFELERTDGSKYKGIMKMNLNEE